MAVRQTRHAPAIVDVAAEAGVSLATASRASPTDLAEKTRRRVMRSSCAGLCPAQPPGALAAAGRDDGGRLRRAGLGAAFYAGALKRAQDALQAAGYHVLVVNTGARPARERDALGTPPRPPGRRAAGCDLRWLRGHRRPAVFFDNVPPEPARGGRDGQ